MTTIIHSITGLSIRLLGLKYLTLSSWSSQARRHGVFRRWQHHERRVRHGLGVDHGSWPPRSGGKPTLGPAAVWGGLLHHHHERRGREASVRRLRYKPWVTDTPRNSILLKYERFNYSWWKRWKTFGYLNTSRLGIPPSTLSMSFLVPVSSLSLALRISSLLPYSLLQFWWALLLGMLADPWSCFGMYDEQALTKRVFCADDGVISRDEFLTEWERVRKNKRNFFLISHDLFMNVL